MKETTLHKLRGSAFSLDFVSNDVMLCNVLNVSGGVLTTSVTSGQQWDAPNAWPPLVLLLIEGIRTLQVDSAVDLAVQSACKICTV